MATESFLIPEPLTLTVKGWGELSWEDVYAEHRPVVQRALDKDTSVIYTKNEYGPDLIQIIEDCCVEGLKNLIDSFRQKFPKTAQPKDCAWAHLILDSEKYIPIQNKLQVDKQLKKAIGKHVVHDSYNIAMAISDEYVALVNSINNATFSGCEYPCGQ